MHECSEVRADISALITGGLDEDREAEVRAHLEQCAECRKAFDETEALFRAGGAFAKAAESAVPFDLTEKVRARIESRRSRPVTSRSRRITARHTAVHRRRSGRRNRLYVVFSLVAAAAVLVLVLLPRDRTDTSISRDTRIARDTGKDATEEALLPSVEVNEPDEELTTVDEAVTIARMPSPAVPSVGEALPEPPVAEHAGPQLDGPAEQPVSEPAETLPSARPDEKGTPQVPSSGKEATTRPVGRLALIDGSVYYKRSGADKWFKAAEGTRLLPGAEIDTRLGRVIVELTGGGLLYSDDHTVAGFSEGRVRLERGTIYCQTGGAGTFVVVTPDGEAQHLGTKFLVKATVSGTTVVVEEGRVAVRNEQGEVEVSTGYEVRLRKGLAPGRLVRTEPSRHLAWVNALRPERLVFADDFTNAVLGRWPRGWRKHKDTNRLGYETLRDPIAVRGPNLCIGCPNPPSGTTQHAGIPLEEWSRSFRIELRVFLDGPSNSRTGMEIWGENSALSVEYDAATSHMKLCRNPGATWKTAKQVPFSVPQRRWTSWIVTFNSEGLSVSVDGVPVIALEDTQGLSVKNVSLITRGINTAYFDDVRVFVLDL